MRRQSSGRLLLVVLAAVTLAIPAASQAAIDVDEACGSTFVHNLDGNWVDRDMGGNGWNVPWGDLVLSRSKGPVRRAIDGLGEGWSLSHTMLSGGQWFAMHSSRNTPGTTNNCSTPFVVDDLQYGFPGASGIRSESAFVYLYDPDWDPWGYNYAKGPELLWYQRGRDYWGMDHGQYSYWSDIGQSIAYNIMWNYPQRYYQVYSGDLVWIYQPWGTSAWRDYNPYFMYQFRDLQWANYDAWGPSGTVCSTWLAQAQYKRWNGNDTGANRSYLPVYSHQYTNWQVQNAAVNIWWEVHDECEFQFSYGWGSFLKGIGCAGAPDPCHSAGWQLMNCMGWNACADGSSWFWDNYQGSITANSISPDWLSGWVSGQDYWTLPGASVWAWDNAQTLQFNAGGSVYNCWY